MENDWPDLDTVRTVGEGDKPRSGLYLLVDSIRTRESRGDLGALSHDPAEDFEKANWCTCFGDPDPTDDGLFDDDLGELNEVFKHIEAVIGAGEWESCRAEKIHYVDYGDEECYEVSGFNGEDCGPTDIYLHAILVGPLAVAEGEPMFEGETPVEPKEDNESSMDTDTSDEEDPRLKSREELIRKAMKEAPFFEILERCRFFCWETRPSH